MANSDTYDFIISDENEIMLILYSRESAPENPEVRLNPETRTVELYRNGEDAVTLQYVDSDVFNNLAEDDKLLVCEIQPTDDPDETEIVYAYHATIVE
ncbi:MAG: hypothetical protein II830_02620 [Alphaproteobacteria bacterium]|nr:hypothetical protein [Alphaproteobacteria bacterium]